MRLVAQACGIEQTLGKKGVRGVLKSVASRQAFLSEKSHRIRFVYTPKHSSWLNQIETVFGVIMRKVIRRGSFTLGGGPAEQAVELHRLLQSGVRQAVPLDVHRSSADGQASGVKRGKRRRVGILFGSCTPNCELSD